MAAPFLLALHGELTVVGKSPDGDSIRFTPDSRQLLDELARAAASATEAAPKTTECHGFMRLALRGAVGSALAACSRRDPA